MGFRLVVALLVMCGGLYGCFQELTAERWREPTIWFQRQDATKVVLSEAFQTEMKAIDERRKVRWNRLYVANLRAKRQTLAKNWSPNSTLFEIVRQYNPSLSGHSASEIAQAIQDSAKRHSLDPFLVAALIAQESRFRPGAISPGGAVGLGQILPSTASGLGVNPYSAIENIEGCSKYLSSLKKRWRGSQNQVHLALASYNAGPGAVEKYGGVPPYRITQKYVAKITSRRQRFRDLALENKNRWLSANGPVMRDLYGATIPPERSLLEARRAQPSS